MIRINARWIVAFMEYVKSIGNLLARVYLPGKPMGERKCINSVRTFSSGGDYSVALHVSFASPFDTPIVSGALFFKESIEQSSTTIVTVEKTERLAFLPTIGRGGLESWERGLTATAFA